jgi:hypothetical protein
MSAAADIHYEVAERVRGIAPGGIGAIHLLARKLGRIDDRLNPPQATSLQRRW